MTSDISCDDIISCKLSSDLSYTQRHCGCSSLTLSLPNQAHALLVSAGKLVRWAYTPSCASNSLSVVYYECLCATQGRSVKNVTMQFLQWTRSPCLWWTVHAYVLV